MRGLKNPSKTKDRTLEELKYIRKQYSFSRVIEMRVK